MDEQKNTAPKRTSPWILGGIVLFTLTFLVLLQSSNMWRNLTVESASDTLLLYALSSLNFFAFVIFGFIFIRSILKLARQRRALQLGSRIKTRLLLYFIAISILPTVAMAGFSYLFMNRALERWFSQIPENVVREAQLVQHQAVQDQNAKLNETAAMLARVLENQNPDDRFLGEIAEKGNLTRIEILDESGRILAANEQTLEADQKKELDRTLTLIREKKYFDIGLADGRGFDAATAKMTDGRTLVVIPDLRREENVSQLVESSLKEFDSLKEKNKIIRQIGLLTLGVLTFLLIFASSWTAFYIAKGVTRPIRALAEGADEIARGNLGYRIDVLAEDELALLVSAFNEMSATLEQNSAELGERKKYIETVLQSLSTGVISFDSDNRVTTINKAAINIFRLENAGFEGLKLKKLVGAENFAVLEKLLGRAKRIGYAGEQTVLQREPSDGSGETNESLPVALSAAALPETADGKSGGVVLVIEDLSELIAAQRASAWQEVARRMAHEIKNPLTPIQLSAERIVKNFYRNAKTQDPSRAEKAGSNGEAGKGQLARVIDESAETILREVSSLKSMVDEFSRFARLPHARLESGDLNETIRQSAALYEDRFADVEIKLDLAENLPPAMIDEEQIKRVLVNLIENALESFKGDNPEKMISIKTFQNSARDIIVVQVSDNGSGIAPQDFSRLFQPYFSTKGRGTGLGLAIVQRIITEHRGKIRAAANSPRGAKFTVELPVANN
ncbi:MAG: ATP-binding protein [Pyrinomonadaceae bacterium]